MNLQLLSLFCGAGGLDEGFRRAGFTTALALDNSPDAVRTFNHNAGGDLAQHADLARLKAEEFIALVPKHARPIGLIGGPPCQGFSRGNVCTNPHDPRNRLPYRYASLLQAANDRFGLHFFVFENVAGLMGPKHARRLKLITTRLNEAGFNVFKADLDASKFGVAQRRRRLFLVGLNKVLYAKESFQFPAGSAAEAQTVAKAIRGLPQPAFYAKGLSAESIPHHPNHWTMVPKSAKFTSGERNDGRSFKQLQWNEVSPTVAYGNREIHVHPDGGRRLSVFEAMLLQGFPRSYQLTGSLSSQITQVSNAVPPPLAEAIAKAIYSLVKDRLSPELAATSPLTSPDRPGSSAATARR